jgi:iron(III) transport system ATP-binding protein
MSLLSLDNVSKRFGPAEVLKGVSLDIAAGEFVVLIGGSGSGKTTLLRLVAGLERADTGVIALRGEAVDHPAAGRFTPTERRRLAMVFQDYALWPHFTCLQNVEAAVRGAGPARRARATQLLDRVGMAAFADKRPHQISGGQQQRVGVARALAAEPDLLLFDEALSSLDVDIREHLRLQIRDLARETGAAALFVSHDPTDAWRLADTVAVLENGRLVQVATPSALYEKPATARVARFIGAAGGFVATVEADNGKPAVRLGGRLFPIAPTAVPPGAAGLVYVRPEGIKAARNGAPAALAFSAFEAGRWRAYWSLAGAEALVCSLETQPPPATTRLAIAAEHILVFPAER